MRKKSFFVKQRKKLIIAASFLIGLLFLAGCFWYVWHSVFSGQQTNYSGQNFTVKKGDGFQLIALNLERAKLVKSRRFFEIYGLATKKYSQIQPGEYELSASFSPAQILDKMARGEFIKKTLKIVEGWTIKDIAKEMQKQGIESANDFTTTTQTTDFSSQFSFLADKPQGLGLEGYLYPDTYEVRIDDSAEEIIQRILHNFNNKFTPELRQQAQTQKKSYFEIITMASLLEKEVMLYKDKQTVAGILWKRIEKSWPLQVDAALTYVTGRYSLELTRKDLALDSPYNTYKHKGLPQGPICNPSQDSLKATLNPIATPYWFYMSNRDGAVLFSKTLGEHSLNMQNR